MLLYLLGQFQHFIVVFITELPAHAAELPRAQPPECSPTAKTLLGLNLHFIVLTYKQPVLSGVFPRIFQAVGGACGVFKCILGGKPLSCGGRMFAENILQLLPTVWLSFRVSCSQEQDGTESLKYYRQTQNYTQ